MNEEPNRAIRNEELETPITKLDPLKMVMGATNGGLQDEAD